MRKRVITQAPAMLDSITPVVITYNEAANIDRTLSALAWAREVVVLDSGSSDETAALVARHANARLVVNPFESHAAQWTFALERAGVRTPWIMALDADYQVGAELVEELRALVPADDVGAYRVPFRYAIDGEVLRATLYPAQTCIVRRDRARYEQHGHQQRVFIDGRVVELRSPMIHDDRKPYPRWLASQRKYARLEADRLRALSWSAMRWRDRVRRVAVLAPWLVPIYVLLVAGVVLDGRAGWRYARERMVAEYLIAKELLWPQK